jgi:hypothetical protein
MQPSTDPITWCNVPPTETIFAPWGSWPIRSLGFLCDSTKAMMRDVLANLADRNPDLELIVPETLVGGNLYYMYKEYDEELYLDRMRPKPQLGHVGGAGAAVHSSNSSSNDDKKHHRRSFGLFSSSKSSSHSSSSSSSSASTVFENTEVCFAVRTAFMHDSAQAIQSRSMFQEVNIEGFIMCKFLFYFVLG